MFVQTCILVRNLLANPNLRHEWQEVDTRSPFGVTAENAPREILEEWRKRPYQRNELKDSRHYHGRAISESVFDATEFILDSELKSAIEKSESLEHG